MIKSNLTAVLTAICVMFILALIALLVILDKPIDNYVGTLTTLGALLVSMGLIGGRIDKVSKNVNGNTTRLLNENAELRRQLGLPTTGSTPVVGFKPTESLMSEDTILRIQRDKDALPAHKEKHND